MATKVNKTHKSVKHEIIDKDNTNTVIAVAAATFVVVFCLFAARALFSQSLYHGRVISEKEKALTQLRTNQQELSTLEASYSTFNGQSTNILGGSSTGAGTLDGNNAQIVLDALPNAYDYIGLSSSFEQLLRDGGYTIESIGGSEQGGLSDATTTATTGSSSSVATEIPYSLSFIASTERTQDFIQTLERSIRPIYVDAIQIQAGENTLLTGLTLRTFYADEKSFTLGSTEVE